MCDFFAFVGEFSEMVHKILLIEFYLDLPLLPWQQNLRQNGPYTLASTTNITKILAFDGGAG